MTYSIEFKPQLEMIGGIVAESQIGEVITPAADQAHEGKNVESRKDMAVTMLHKVNPEVN